MRGRISRTVPISSWRSGRSSLSLKKFSISRAATAVSERCCLHAASSTAASTRLRRWWTRRVDGWAIVRPIELGDLNAYQPPAPVAATTVFRAIYYASDRRAFFEHVAAFTERKLVFDLNPRQYRVEEVLGDLRAAGFGDIALRPFFMPQTIALPRPAAAVARGLELSGPVARLALRYRFTYLVAASR